MGGIGGRERDFMPANYTFFSPRLKHARDRGGVVLLCTDGGMGWTLEEGFWLPGYSTLEYSSCMSSLNTHVLTRDYVG